VLNSKVFEIDEELQRDFKQFVEQTLRQLVRFLINIRNTLLSRKLCKYRYIRKN